MDFAAVIMDGVATLCSNACCCCCCLQSSRQDLVLFPQLLTLPIKSCLGPRVLYARKRQIKLLAPSLAALVGQLSNHASEWREHKMVPLDFWLGASDKKMCAAMDLNLEDYQRWVGARELLGVHTVQPKGFVSCLQAVGLLTQHLAAVGGCCKHTRYGGTALVAGLFGNSRRLSVGLFAA